MHFVVHALDKPDALARRMEVLDVHRAYIAEAENHHPVKILMAGPLTDDEGASMKGSFFLVEADSRSAVEALLAGDPMAGADVWSDLQITAFTMRVNKIGAV